MYIIYISIIIIVFMLLAMVEFAHNIITVCFLLTLSSINFGNIECTEHFSTSNSDKSQLKGSARDCPVWHYYAANDGMCKCYEYRDMDYIKCTKDAVMLTLGRCMTHTGENGMYYVAICPYFQLRPGHNASNYYPGFMVLPNNASKLNDYMCGPMNRQGLLCSQCIDGFSPSFTSVGYKCSNCTDVRYGTLFYILSEFIPSTVFYLVILIFRINLTSSPMTAYLFYSQLIMFELTIDRHPPISQILVLEYLGILPYTVYGLWNLDFFSLCHTTLLRKRQTEH